MTSPAALLLPPCCTSASLPPCFLPLCTWPQLKTGTKKMRRNVSRWIQLLGVVVFFMLQYTTALWYTPLDNLPVVTASGRCAHERCREQVELNVRVIWCVVIRGEEGRPQPLCETATAIYRQPPQHASTPNKRLWIEPVYTPSACLTLCGQTSMVRQPAAEAAARLHP